MAAGGSRRIACLARPGAGPALVWLGGLKSDMRATKASALDARAADLGRACLRFDYSGHGESAGRFEDGTVTAWLEDAEAALAAHAPGRIVLVGSSLGGWIALLLALALQRRGDAARLAGLVLIAPALDMGTALIEPSLTQAERAALAREGVARRPSPYDPEGMPIARALLDDCRRHDLMGAMIEIATPIHVVQGMNDADVPFAHALALMERLSGGPAILTLIRDGDHRLSRPQDIATILRAAEGIG